LYRPLPGSPKAINECVPDRRELGDQQRLTQRNPDIVNDQIAAHKICNVQIAGGSDAFSVFFQSIEESLCLADIRGGQPLAPAGRDGFADVDWRNRVGSQVVSSRPVASMTSSLSSSEIMMGILKSTARSLRSKK
jgi:hypothetical protein